MSIINHGFNFNVIYLHILHKSSSFKDIPVVITSSENVPLRMSTKNFMFKVKGIQI